MTMEGVNELRKNAQRLADEAVRQYQVAKKKFQLYINDQDKRKGYERKLERLKENREEKDWSPEEKALKKVLEDYDWKQNKYDYEDDWYDNYWEGVIKFRKRREVPPFEPQPMPTPIEPPVDWEEIFW